MKQDITSILEELYAIDPGLRDHERELTEVVARLLEARPDTKFDAVFAKKLKRELMEQPHEPARGKININNIFFVKKFSYALLAAIAVVAIAVSVYYYPSGGGRKLVMNDATDGQAITKLADNAFGELSVQPGAEGQVAFGLGAGRTQGGGGGGQPALDQFIAADSIESKIAPEIYPYPFYKYTYTYAGEPVENDATQLPVFKRNVRNLTSGSIAQALRNFSLDVIDLGKFGQTEVRYLNFAEQGTQGFNVSIDFTLGVISMFREMPYLAAGEPYRPMDKSELLPESEIISIANRFMQERGISLVNYGDPIITDPGYFRILAGESSAGGGTAGLIAPDFAPEYIPEIVSVVYPLSIEGVPVYDQGGNPDGMFVSVALRDRAVTGVINIALQQYDSSNYAVETDVMALLDQYNRNQYQYDLPQEAQIQDVEIQLGTPTLGLTRIYNYKGGLTEELFAPAYIFPIIEKPVDQYFYSDRIAISLIKDALGTPGGPFPMPLESVRDTVDVSQ